MKDTKPIGLPCIMYGDIYIKFDTYFNNCDYCIDKTTAQSSVKAKSGDVTIKDFKNGRLYLDDACDRIDDIALKKINERSDLRKGDLLFSSIGRIGDES